MLLEFKIRGRNLKVCLLQVIIEEVTSYLLFLRTYCEHTSILRLSFPPVLPNNTADAYCCIMGISEAVSFDGRK
jgi:hypothetical protein